MTAFFRLLKLLAVLVVIGSPVRAASAEASRCFEDWSDAAPIMLKEGLLSTRDLHEQARQHLTGALLRITLCQEGKRYTYRLLVRGANGQLNMVTVDARHPFDH
jgi:hypothetical protein